MPAKLYNLKAGVAADGESLRPVIVASADGAIPLTPDAFVIVTKAGVCAMTLAAPSGDVKDGHTLTFYSTGAYAHTVTQTTPGFNGGSTASDVATFGAAAGNGMELTAYNGNWYATSLTNVTLG